MNHSRLFALVILLVANFHYTVQAEVKLPSILGSHMVLQRDAPITLWGWDDSGQKVTVSLGEDSASATANNDGLWMVELKALKAGGPHQIKIQGTTAITLEDVLIGEVWLCSGQSNMEWTVRQSLNPEEEARNGNHPQIRHIKFPHRPSAKPEDDIPSDGWKLATPETVPNFTAVGYFFGRKLQSELDVPIGLIGSNWGGTRIEPWTPPVGFQSVPALKEITDNLDNFPVVNQQGRVNHQTPLALYNGMIHNFRHLNFRGAIWYQGESNRGEGMLYHEKMKALIQGWRKVFDNADMPFYFVQLAPFTYGGSELALPEIWEAQTATLALPNTGMAVTTDISNLRDIHPKNKQDVGARLARWALAKTYGYKDLVYSGPLYKSHKVVGSNIEISFVHTAGKLATNDDKPLSHFQVAGADGEFKPATAVIKGEQVIVASDAVAKPVHVRFGWHQLAEPNLVNAAGLPASPFRTDK